MWNSIVSVPNRFLIIAFSSIWFIYVWLSCENSIVNRTIPNICCHVYYISILTGISLVKMINNDTNNNTTETKSSKEKGKIHVFNILSCLSMHTAI